MVEILEYPEFMEDIKELWKDIITKYTFQVIAIDDGEIHLLNNEVKINFLLNVYDRVGFVIENIKTDVKYTETYLHLFFNGGLKTTVWGDEDYPISKREWINYFSEEEYRIITRIDLPIIKKEIMTYFPQLVAGDFSCEPKWLEWVNEREKNIKPYDPDALMKDILGD